MPQRRTDYMSTKNVGGNKPPEPDTGGGDMWAYLGHFRNPQYLREGHNTVPGTGAAGKVARGAKRGVGKVAGAAGKVVGKVKNVLFGSDAKMPERQRATRKQLGSETFRARNRDAAANDEVRQARRALRGARASNGNVDEARAALDTAKGERKVVRGERREAFKGLRSARQAVKSARKTGGDVGAAREALKSTRAGVKSQFAGEFKYRKALSAARKRGSSGGLLSKINPF